MIEAAPGDYRQIVVETLALVLDVDGVVSPVPGPTDWGDDLSAGEFFGPVTTSPELCRRLDRVGLHPSVVGLWLTSWHAQTRAGMSLFPGRDWLHSDPDGYVAEFDASGWWKADALLGWIDQQPASAGWSGWTITWRGRTIQPSTSWWTASRREQTA